MPVNIEYNFDKGKINLFATDTISFKKQLITLISLLVELQMNLNLIIEGPDLNIYIDDMDFKSGDKVSKSPLLIVEGL